MRESLTGVGRDLTKFPIEAPLLSGDNPKFAQLGWSEKDYNNHLAGKPVSFA